MSSAKPKYLYRYGIVSVQTERYPNRAYKRIVVACVQFVPSGRKYNTKGSFTKRVFDFPENSAMPEFRQVRKRAKQFARHVLGIYARCVLLSNEDTCEIVGDSSNFLCSVVKQDNATFKKRALSANGTYYEYCRTKPFHTAMDRMIATYTYQGPKLVSGDCGMIASYLNKNKPQ
jgi:hypothetical protein